MGLIVVNAVVLAAVVAVLATAVRRRRRSAPETEQRPVYVPRAWPRYGIYDWLAATPRRMFSWLVFIPTAGLVAGVVLLITRDHFGAVLIVASMIGVVRTCRPAQAALRAARSPHRSDR